MPHRRRPRHTLFIATSVGCTALSEFLTVLGRHLFGGATEWTTAVDPPVWAQIHHMFWAIPIAAVAWAAWERFPRTGAGLAGMAVGLGASDLLHHFVVLPLWVGHTGWHWP